MNDKEYLIKGKYILMNFCKGGAFGEVFFARHSEKNYEVAIKFSDSQNEETNRQYENEVEVMKVIKKLAGVRANLFPKLLVNGFLEDKKLNYIVMPKYDLDLERLFIQNKRKFKLETIVTIGLQVLERLEIMHNCGLVHNDLKPQNMMAVYKSNFVILIDFGLTMNLNIPPKANYGFKGTPYFASNNQLVRGKLGPRDDLESLLYILIYFCQGFLPWARNVQILGEELQAHIEVQHVISCRDPEELCAELEPEFQAMLTAIQNQSNKARPDYRFYKKSLTAIKERNNFQGVLEWFKPEPLKSNTTDINIEQNLLKVEVEDKVQYSQKLQSQTTHKQLSKQSTKKEQSLNSNQLEVQNKSKFRRKSKRVVSGIQPGQLTNFPSDNAPIIMKKKGLLKKKKLSPNRETIQTKFTHQDSNKLIKKLTLEGQQFSDISVLAPPDSNFPHQDNTIIDPLLNSFGGNPQHQEIHFEQSPNHNVPIIEADEEEFQQNIVLQTQDSQSGDLLDQETDENSFIFLSPFKACYKVNNLKYISSQNTSKHPSSDKLDEQ
eukprot:403331935